MKVYDMEKVERDFDWAKAKYGVAFVRAIVAPGQKVYRLTELWEKTGHTSLVTQVLNEEGQPIDRADVAFYWPDAPSPPDPPTEVYAHDWYPNFVHGFTNVNGDVGPGMGKGAYHGPGEGGPHAVWVRDPNIPSDICQKLGMLAGTFHDHLDQKFKLMIEGGTPMPEEGRFVEVGRSHTSTESENRIVVHATGSRNFYDTRVHLVVGNKPDRPDWVAPEPIMPEELSLYRIYANYTPAAGETSRSFWVVIQTPQGKALSEPLGFGFQTDQYGIYQVEVEWQTGEEPVEPEPPPDEELPDDLAELFDMMGDEHVEIAERHARLGEQCYLAAKLLRERGQ